MQIIDMSAAVAGLGAIALGLGGLLVFGRDRTRDEHDVSDYHAPKSVAVTLTGDPRPFVDAVDAARRSLRPGALLALADPAEAGVTPPLARRLLIEQAVPTLSDAAVAGIADEWLREIAAEQRTLAGAR